MKHNLQGASSAAEMGWKGCNNCRTKKKNDFEKSEAAPLWTLEGNRHRRLGRATSVAQEGLEEGPERERFVFHHLKNEQTC